MRSFLLSLSFLSLLLSIEFGATSALASVAAGEDCSQLGVTRLADDKASIVACLFSVGNGDPDVTNCSSSAPCKWKAMTTNTTGSTAPTISYYPISRAGNITKNIGVHKFCALGMAGESVCGRCALWRDEKNFSWTLDAASCDGSAFEWCSAYCFD